MRTFVLKGLIPSSVLVLLIACFSGCGSSNNDQGTAITNLGFFATVAADPCDDILPSGLTGISVPLSFAITEDNSASTGATSDSVFGGGVQAAIAVQNNLDGQFVRIERMFLDYDIVGSSFDPPSTSSVVPIFLSPFNSGGGGGDEEGGGSTGFDSSLPDSFADEDTNCHRGFAAVLVLPSDVRTWLNLNRASLPEAPFTIIVTATVTGLTSAGDRHDTNETQMFIEIVPDIFIPPTDGTVGGTATEELAGDEPLTDEEIDADFTTGEES